MKKGRGVFGFLKNKGGQVTIFIIIAVLVVGIVALIYFLIPRVETGSGFDAQNPRAFIQNCLEDRIEEVVSIVSSQGGSVNPEHYFTFNDIPIEYLCYTNENYKLCVVQQPLLKQHIESEIKEEISGDVESCFNSLMESYRANGYEDIQLEKGITKIELLPKRVIVSFAGYVLTVTKAETARHDSFDVVLDNNLYELISIAKSIVEWETTLGDADPGIYMTYYPDLDVKKNLREDGTRIYTITDRNTGDEFQFASRSLAFPPGY